MDISLERFRLTPFNRKLRKFRKQPNGRVINVKKFSKVMGMRAGSVGCPLFRKFRKILFYSPLEMSGNETQNFDQMDRRQYRRSCTGFY